MCVVGCKKKFCVEKMKLRLLWFLIGMRFAFGQIGIRKVELFRGGDFWETEIECGCRYERLDFVKHIL